jgi:hypothetical protein
MGRVARVSWRPGTPGTRDALVCAVRSLGAAAVAVAAMIVLVDGAERAEVAAALVLGLQKQVEAGRHPSPAVAVFVRALRDTTTTLRDTSGQKEGTVIAWRRMDS